MDADFSLKRLIRKEKRVVGQESYEVEEKTRGWFESLAFWPNYEYVTKYRDIKKNVTFVNGSELAQDFFTPVDKNMMNNRANALEHALKEAEKIKELYKKEFNHLNTVLKGKLDELRLYATEKDKVEERIKELEEKLSWLKRIMSKIEKILEI